MLAHARALLTSSPEGRTAYIPADSRDPAAILADPVANDILDFSKPVALMLVAILHFIQHEDHPADRQGALVHSTQAALVPYLGLRRRFGNGPLGPVA